MPRALFALVLLSLALGAQAQRQPPASIEIRASYCISVLTGRAQDAETFASLPAPKAMQEGWREAQRRYEQEVRQLRSYLVPRMKFLDGEPLLAAADRGQADVNAFLRTQRACEARCRMRAGAAEVDAGTPQMACFNACAAEDAAAGRVNDCGPPNAGARR